jgi:tRNA A37 threonylcarbamoyladenosine dehydratase
MLHEFSRTELLIGKEALARLKCAKVAVFGIGGVGSFVVEGLARAGIGRLVLVDSDVVSLTNLNRQLIATRKTLGRPKVEVMKERILEINPEAEVTIHQAFYLPDTAPELLQDDYDYIVDAVDTVTAKIDLIVQAKKRGIPIISCMGAGNKMDPTCFKVADIYSTSVDPLAKVMRRELKSRGIDTLKVVYSAEPPIKPMKSEEESTKKQIPGSISFVPPVAGLIIAGEVVKDLIGYPDQMIKTE